MIPKPSARFIYLNSVYYLFSTAFYSHFSTYNFSPARTARLRAFSPNLFFWFWAAGTPAKYFSNSSNKPFIAKRFIWFRSPRLFHGSVCVIYISEWIEMSNPSLIIWELIWLRITSTSALKCAWVFVSFWGLPKSLLDLTTSSNVWHKYCSLSRLFSFSLT